MTPKVDIVEVYPIIRRKVRLGYRFRFVKAGREDSTLVSEGLYDTPERAAEVATIMNRDCFAGGYKLRKVRTA